MPVVRGLFVTWDYCRLASSDSWPMCSLPITANCARPGYSGLVVVCMILPFAAMLGLSRRRNHWWSGAPHRTHRPFWSCSGCEDRDSVAYCTNGTMTNASSSVWCWNPNGARSPPPTSGPNLRNNRSLRRGIISSFSRPTGRRSREITARCADRLTGSPIIENKVDCRIRQVTGTAWFVALCGTPSICVE